MKNLLPRFALLCLSLIAISESSLFGAVQAQEATPAPVIKIPETLMFTVDEYNDIQARLSANGDDGKNKAVPENISLYLSTIVYYGPNDWTIWVNGSPISPGEEFSTFKVTDIGTNFVDLLVPLSAKGMSPVRLAPNQSFIAQSGAVVEGPWKQ